MAVSIRFLTLALGIALAALFLWLALRDVDFALIRLEFVNADWWLIPPFLACIALFYWLKARRWGVILDGDAPIGTKRLMPSMMIGFAGNNVLPLRLGEILRIYLGGRDLNMSKATVLATLVLERVFDAVTILAVLAIAVYVLGPDSPEVDAAEFLLFAGTSIAVLVVYGFVFTPSWLEMLGLRVFRRLPQAAQSLVEPRIRQLRAGFAVLKNARVLVPILLNSTLQWVLLATCIYISIAAFGSDIPPLAAVIVMGLVIAGISLPSAPGFIGTIEYCFVAGLGFFGIGPSEALSAAIFYHVLMFLSVTLAGAYYMRRYDMSLGQLRRKVDNARVS